MEVSYIIIKKNWISKEERESLLNGAEVLAEAQLQAQLEPGVEDGLSISVSGK
jgi:hypothetical protein